MPKHLHRLGTVAVLLIMLGLAAACVPLFTNGIFQTLQLVFELSSELREGEKRVVHVAVFPESVEVKKNLVRVSGRLTAPDGEALPERIDLQAELEGDGDGKVVQRIRIQLKVEDDGRFEGSSKIRKNVGAGDLLTVAAEASGADLAAGTRVELCVDLVRKKKDLRGLPDCVETGDGGGGGGGGNAVTLSSLQDQFFTPTCALAGCHSAGSASAGLVLEAGEAHANLVGVASSQRPDLERVAPNAPESSYLIKKLRGDGDISGQRMPLGGPFLDDPEIDRFVRWINAGAPNN